MAVRGIVDFHSHFFSLNFFELLAAQSSQPGTVAERLGRVAKSTGLSLPSPDLDRHLELWLSQMDEHGVDHMVTFASLPDEAEVVAEAAGHSNGRLSPFALIDPTADRATQRAERLFGRMGFKGLLLFPAMHHYHLDDPRARGVLEVAASLHAPVVVHCGLLTVKLRDQLGLPRPFDLTFANPLSIIPAANRFPNLPLIIPHFGAGFLRETLMAGVMCENVHVDSSSSNSWIGTQPVELRLLDVFERVLGVFGPERVIFGTDSSTFPRGWRHDLFTLQREALGALEVSSEDQRLIFGDNARKLLGQSV